MRDLRDAYRALKSAPVVFTVAVLSLALAIGASTAIFSLVDNLFLKELPARNPDRLAVITQGPDRDHYFTQPAWEHIRELEIFESAFAWALGAFAAGPEAEAERLEIVIASGEIFDVLGLPTALGRTFGESDEEEAVAVLGYGFWQRRFGGSVDAVGETLFLQGAPFTIVGVTAPAFRGLDVGRRFDVVIPIWSEPLVRGDSSRLGSPFAQWLRIMGRLGPGRTLDSARQALRAAQPGLREATLPSYTFAPARERYLSSPLDLQSAAAGTTPLRSRYRLPLLVLMGVVSVVLLVACANVANLLLARGTARRRELATRSALGASRLRLVRQLAVESLFLVAGATVLGLAFGHAGSRLLVAQISTSIEEIALGVPLDWRTFGFSCLAGLLSALLFGSLPAWRATGVHPGESLRSAYGTSGSPRGLGAGDALLVGQVTLSLVLVAAAGLFLQSFVAISSVSLGFEPERVLNVEVDTRRAGWEPEARPALMARARDAALSLPGVAYAGASPAIPIGFRGATAIVELPDAPEMPEEVRTVWKNMVTPGWFETFGMRVVSGRGLEARDVSGATPVAVVNETFARRFLGASSALGRVFREQRLARGEIERVSLVVVGIVEDAVYRSVREPPPPTFFVALAQSGPIGIPFFNVVARPAAGEPSELARAVTSRLRELEPRLDLTVRPMAEQVRATYNQERVLAIVAASFGALATMLAALGLAGVTLHRIAGRRKEIAIGMALGASARRVAWAAVSRTLALTAAGLVVGTVLSLWLVRFVESLLFALPTQVNPVYGVAATLMALVAAAAAWLPARRAAQVDPASLLREM